MTHDELILARQRILADYQKSDACKLFYRLKVYDIGYSAFLMNFKDWEREIESRIPNEPMQFGNMRDDREWFDSFLTEASRALHNFVASAFTLVDTCRALYKEIYLPKDLFPDYQAQIDQRFIDDGVSSFVKDLRQFCQHYRLPLMSAKVGITLTPTGGMARFSVPISLQEIKRFSGWGSKSKTFIATFETKQQIDLELVLQQYRDKVVAFHDWMSARQREIHADAYAQRAEATAKIAEINQQLNPTAESEPGGGGYVS